jgi:hypothetical protein
MMVCAGGHKLDFAKMAAGCFRGPFAHIKKPWQER